MYYSNYKFVFVIILQLFAQCYCASTTPPDDRTIDDRYDALIACLVNSGIGDGKIFPRNDGEEYAELNYQWNTLWGYMTPLIYLKATTTRDVQIGVICARKSKIRCVPRSGGHSYSKNGFGDENSLVIDMKSMNSIDVNKEKMTAKVGPGALNGQIMYNGWKAGVLVSQGICPSVGAGGLFQGGGYGHFSRLLGMATDSVIGLEMVDARGRLVLVNNSTNTDLFYALRGGGGGNFGIVTSFTINVYPSPRTIVFGRYEYSFAKNFRQVFTAWQKVVASDSFLSRRVFCIIEMELDRMSMRLFGINIGNEPDMTEETIEELRKYFGFPEPGPGSSLKTYTHEEFIISEAQVYSDTPLTDIAQVAQMTKHNKVYNKKVKSYFVNKILNAKEIDKLTELLTEYLPYAGLYWENNGGKITENPGTCFQHRLKASYSAQLKPLNSSGKLKDVNGDAAKIRFFEATKTLLNHRRSYQNYIDRDMQDYLTRFYGSALPRLIEIKEKWDPSNVFHSCESIPVYQGQKRICDL
ncbi:hypothetical protein HA402_003432 [Bradysia odoriphaga]|nr:hypothetical protein HA402_003432 [Bradysia odoriphaga]